MSCACTQQHNLTVQTGSNGIVSFLIFFFNYERKALVYGYYFALPYSCSWWCEEIRQDTKCKWYYLDLINSFPLSEKASEVRVDMPTSLRNTWRKGVIFHLPLVSKGRYTPRLTIFCSFSLPTRPRPYARKQSPFQINTQGREISIKMPCNSCPHKGCL